MVVVVVIDGGANIINFVIFVLFGIFLRLFFMYAITVFVLCDFTVKAISYILLL